jgi:Family of unknown function (DUF6117)
LATSRNSIGGHSQDYADLPRDNRRQTNSFRDSRGITNSAALCAVGWQDGEYLMTPFGHLADGNPYEMYVPPDSGPEEAAPRAS